jgi:two-component system phosphate regulon response regulator PhoB
MPLEQQRILVVDDNQILRTLLAQVLEAAGYIAIAAESAEAALEVLRFQPPDLCLVDQVMLRTSGSAGSPPSRSPASPGPRRR